MSTSKIKSGDRVAAYINGERHTGVVMNDNYNGKLLFAPDRGLDEHGDDVFKDGEYGIVHAKQCRKLKPKAPKKTPEELAESTRKAIEVFSKIFSGRRND